MAFALLLAACKQEKLQDKHTESTELITASGNGWQGLEDFHAIEVSGVTKVVVFIRDTAAVHIDDEAVQPGDKRVSIDSGTLHIAPVDAAKAHRIQSVRIYTPQLDCYTISDCGEANISGDTLCGEKFLLDVRRCNIFRGNTYIICKEIDIRLHKMLMAQLRMQGERVSLRADSLQHVELNGQAGSFALDAPDRIRPLIDTSKLKIDQ